jgi:hypothetical protein
VSTPTDDAGRYVWVVTWGRPGRMDWRAVLVKAYDAEEARQAARDEYPHLLPPEGVVLAAPATARSVLAGRPDATVKNLPLLG